MAFAQPLFLFALAALAIPVIIHLFNFRRYKKVYFTNVRFIQEINQESKNRSQLKHLLILLMRLLAIASLVLAFAQPFIPSPLQKKKVSGKRAVSIYIDNSFSMEALTPNGSMLEAARARAREIADAFQPSDLFQLLTSDFEGRHQRFVTMDEFRTLVDEVKISPSRKTVAQVIQRQNDLLSTVAGNNRSAFIISDFQRSTTTLDNLATDSSVSYYFIPLSAESQSNLYIDTAWFDSPVQLPGSAVKLKVRIRNTSPDPVEKVPVRLLVNNKQKAIASFSVNGNGESDIIMPFTNEKEGLQACRLEITDYPVTWDDTLYLSYQVGSSIPVLCIHPEKENLYLNALFLNDSSFSFRNVFIKQLDYSSFQRYPIIILDGPDEYSSGLVQELVRYAEQGGRLLVFPPVKGETASIDRLLEAMSIPGFSGIDTARQKVSFVNTEHPVFRDVFEKKASGKVALPDNTDLPFVLKHYVIGQKVTSEKEDLLRLQGGDAFLSVFRCGKGNVFLCAVPADDSWSNFPKHSIFVPALYNIALLSQPDLQGYYLLNGDEPVVLTNDSLPAEEVYKIRKAGSDYEFIPEIRSFGTEVYLDPHDQIREAGQYLITKDHTVLRGIAFNYDRRESDLSCLTAAEINKALGRSGTKYLAVIPPKKDSVTRQIAQLEKGAPLWKIFILLALLFFGLEILVIRLMKG